MSSHMYLRCVSHDPYIQSEMVAHNRSQLYSIQKDIKERKTLAGAWILMDRPDLGDHYANSRLRFFAEHWDCALEIWDEYGTQYPLVDDEELPERGRVWVTYSYDYYPSIDTIHGSQEAAEKMVTKSGGSTSRFWIEIPFGGNLDSALVDAGRPQWEGQE